MHRGTVTVVVACIGHVSAGFLAAGCGLHLWGLAAADALLLGLAVSATFILAHLIIATARDHREILSVITGSTPEVRHMEQRLLGLERSILNMAEELEAEKSRQISDLATELSLLRTVMDRVAGSVITAQAEDDEAGSRDMLALAAPRNAPQPAAAAARETLAVLRSALQESRVDLYLQPIVRLPSRRIAHYETFSRLRDEQGSVIMPGDYLEAARHANLAAPLDNLLLFRSINLIRRLGPRRPGVKLFCNISGASLADDFFLSELVSFMKLHPELAERLVFELDAGDIAMLPSGAQPHLAALARLGFAFSVDNIRDMRKINPERLAAMNVQFVKVDADVLLWGACPIDRNDLKDWLERSDIELIVTRIEDDRTVAEVLELSVAYGQGFVFGGPRPSRSDASQAGETQAA